MDLLKDMATEDEMKNYYADQYKESEELIEFDKYKLEKPEKKEKTEEIRKNRKNRVIIFRKIT